MTIDIFFLMGHLKNIPIGVDFVFWTFCVTSSERIGVKCVIVRVNER